ncbi:hypothetical protein [Yinghuangia sp. YIM S09857]|uniref:hypothetical protein n=1 Tax=Yinghuangia sp. YIM S09857 TaxID=3436929 RepID=UPI003F52B689
MLPVRWRPAAARVHRDLLRRRGAIGRGLTAACALATLAGLIATADPDALYVALWLVLPSAAAVGLAVSLLVLGGLAFDRHRARRQAARGATPTPAPHTHRRSP